MKAKISKPCRGYGSGLLLASLLFLLLPPAATVYAGNTLTYLEQQGRKIYRDGSDGSNTGITVHLIPANDAFSATTFPCVNCHGLEGEGKQEGSLNAPPINSQTLFTNTTTRPGYDDNTAIRAISKGINARNKALSGAMPRYALTKQQAQALLAYLKRLGTASDTDAGVSPSEVHLATLLPLSGPMAATGKLLKATLDSCIAELNARGPIYGRNLTLTALDSGSTSREILESTKRLISETKAIALVGGYFPELTSDIYQLLAQEGLPVIAPFSFMPKESSNSTSAFFYFLPSYADQALALVDYWLDKAGIPSPKLAIVYSDRTDNRNLVPLIRKHLHRYRLVPIAEVVIPQSIQKSPADEIAKLETLPLDAIIFLGNLQELGKLHTSSAKMAHQPVLLGLLAMLGGEVLPIPHLAVSDMMLASPFSLQDDQSFREFTAMLGRYSVPIPSPGLQRLACSAVNFVGEGLKNTGKHLSRGLFIRSLREIKNYPVGIMPPIDFGSNNLQGVKGAYILTVNMNSGGSSISEWVTPLQ